MTWREDDEVTHIEDSLRSGEWTKASCENQREMSQITDRLLHEYINYGGVILTRGEVARRMKQRGSDPRAVDVFAFGSKKVEPSEVDWEYNRRLLALLEQEGEC